jgi:D-3-phosphoglycerate dehydrogenase
LENVILTPHTGSRTHENIARQATMAIWNLVAALKAEEPQARAT